MRRVKYFFANLLFYAVICFFLDYIMFSFDPPTTHDALVLIGIELLINVFFSARKPFITMRPKE